MFTINPCSASLNVASSKLALSEPPQESTHNIAFKLLYEIKNPPVEPVLTWKSILAEDPLTGQHWKGAYGLPPGAWIRDEEDDGDNSSETPSLSSLDISIEFDDASEVEESRDEDAEPVLTTSAQSPATDEQTRILFDGVLAVQYWKSWKTDSQLSRPFNSADSSTFGWSLLLRLVCTH
jgi:gamma-tubulin complex component 5